MNVAFICLGCARWQGDTCQAYPTGIPADILPGGADHRSPRGDEVDGLTFVQNDSPDAKRATAWYLQSIDDPGRNE